VPARSKGKRWKTKFARFVDTFGAQNLAAELNVSRDALYKWVAGAVHMRPVRAMEIVKIARRRKIVISLDEIYQNFDEARGSLSRKS
jgi:hypothetical protein